jgi:hypothetical protein
MDRPSLFFFLLSSLSACNLMLTEDSSFQHNTLLLQGFMHQVWGDSLHHQWTFILQLGSHHKRRRIWRCAGTIHQGHQHGMATHVKELGSELAKQCQPQWSELVFHGHHWRWSNFDIHGCGTSILGLWANIHRNPILLKTYNLCLYVIIISQSFKTVKLVSSSLRALIDSLFIHARVSNSSFVNT